MAGKARRSYSISILTIIVFIALNLSYARSESGGFAAVEKLFLEGSYEKVISQSTKLINSNYGQKEDLYYLKGLSELKTGKFGDARRSFEEIVYRNDKSDMAFDAYMGIGDSYALEGNKGKADNAYNDILKKFPRSKNLAMVRDRLEGGPSVEPAQNITAPGGFTVQVGCFSSRRNAEGLVKTLSGKGYSSHIEMPVSAHDSLYRVKTSPVNSRVDVENLAARLKKDGFPTKICSDDICQR